MRCITSLALAAGFIVGFYAQYGALQAEEAQSPPIVWQDDYAKAMSQAEQQGKMLLIVFRNPDGDRVCEVFESRVLNSEPIRSQLQNWVCVRLPVDAQIRVGGEQTSLLDTPAFKGMNYRSGIAIVDFAHHGKDYYGCVVSTFRFTPRRCYSIRQMDIILNLPADRPEKRLGAYIARMLFRRSMSQRSVLEASKPAVAWMDDYAKAMEAAEQQNKMLFVYFCDGCTGETCTRFKTETLDDPVVSEKLQDYICVQVPLEAKIALGGQEVRLLDHAAYREMLGRPGIAIVDYRTTDVKLRGTVVSVFPITEKLWYTPERMAVILNLPEGTLTQRTLIYAVRIHPEKPASTDSEISPNLLVEAESHSEHQAAIQLQGHHQWETRFQRIVSQLPGGLTAREVCAESWPGEHLVEAAIECVRCWRLSDGHWNAVSSPNRYFGYDMKLGANRTWYATGIFGFR